MDCWRCVFEGTEDVEELEKVYWENSKENYIVWSSGVEWITGKGEEKENEANERKRKGDK